jgi:hypothetical protein
MFVKHLQEYLEQFTTVKGKQITGIGNARIYMEVNGHLEEVRRIEVTKSNKVRFSPHQISFHVKHPHNTFILVEHLGQRSVKLFRGSRILELDACGLSLEACCLSLDACGLLFESLGA